MSFQEEPSVCWNSRTTVLGRLWAAGLPYWAIVILYFLTCSHLLSSRFGCGCARLCRPRWGCREQRGQCSQKALEMSSWAGGPFPGRGGCTFPCPLSLVLGPTRGRGG